MAKENSHKFKLEISQELRELAQLLQKELSSNCPDVSPLYKASEMCKESTDQNELFQYELNNLNFRISLFKKKNPIPKNLSNVTINLNLKVKGICGFENEILIDPFNNLEFNLMINGSFRDGGKTKTAYSCWHLDRDDEEGRDNQVYTHPFYHFQQGGRNLDRGLSYGRFLIVDTPRIAHPPMDAILGVDFVLTNFVEKQTINELRENPIYKRIVRNAQLRIWKPYFLTLARAWEAEDSENWYSQMLFPQLIK